MPESGLKRYMEKNNIDTIKLGYRGHEDPGRYGIRFEEIPTKPTKGLIAISPSVLQYGYLHKCGKRHWLKAYTPVDSIGYSILIYDIK